MILIDYNNLMNIMFGAATSNIMSNKWKNEGKLNNTINPDPVDVQRLKEAFLNSMIIFIKDREKMTKYGEVFIVTDTKHTWRRYYYPPYKQNRRDKLGNQNTYDKWLFNHMIEWSNQIKEVLKVAGYPVFEGEVSIDDKMYGLEADEVIAILTQQFKNDYEYHLIISNDGDFKQVLNQKVHQWDYKEQKPTPTINKKFKEEWIIKTLLKGQKKDNIPSIKQDTMLSDEFIAYFNKHNTDDLEIKYTDIDKELVWGELGKEFCEMKDKEEEKLIESGEKKRAKQWTVYKAMKFGDVAVDKFYEDWVNNIKEYRPWVDNFNRNKDLFLFSRVPDFIQEYIKEKSDELLNTATKPKGLDKMKLKNKLTRDGLVELANLL